MFRIHPIPAFSDNYIWCLYDTDSGKALIVDPGQASPVLEFLSANHLVADTLLITHHHPDHVGGVRDLTQQFPDLRIIGPDNSPFKKCTETVISGSEVVWQDICFRVIAVPGHTLDHVAYFSDTPVEGHPVLFSGDTLFVGGCGRLFEGTAGQMQRSLAQLRALPDITAVYCAHEYTLANLKFARHWLPGDAALAEFEADCQALRNQGQPTVPGTLGQEKKLNLFLRWDDPEVMAAARDYANAAGLSVEDSPVSVFAAVRHGKDHF